MYSNSHYNKPHWDSLKRDIFIRDNYTCQHCGRKEGEITCETQIIKSRYKKKENDLYYVVTPYIIKNNKFLAYSTENERETRAYLNSKDGIQMLYFPHHYKKRSEEIHIDGAELLKKIEMFRLWNPIIPPNPISFKTKPVKIRLYIHHIDGNSENDEPENLISLCNFCHENAHQAHFILKN